MIKGGLYDRLGFYKEYIMVHTDTRTDYVYRMVHENTWKLRRGIIKRYTECGIKWFGEE